MTRLVEVWAAVDLSCKALVYIQVVSKKIIHFCQQYYEENTKFQIIKFTLLEGPFHWLPKEL